MFGFSKPTREKADQALQKAMQTGDFGPVLKMFRKLIEADPEDYMLLHDTGALYLNLGMADEAVDCFRKANEIHESSMHWNNLGRALQQTADFAGAQKAYSKAMDLDAEDPMPWYNLTVCLREMGKMEESIAELEKMTSKHPSHAGSQNDLGLHYEIQGKIEEAVAQLQKAVESDPEYIPSRLNLARMLCEKGKYPDSVEHLEYLSEQGADIEVAAKDGKVRILIDGSLFFEGTYES